MRGGMEAWEYGQLPNMAHTRANMLEQGVLDNFQLLQDLREIFTIEELSDKPISKGTKMTTVCFTGKGNKTRGEYEEMCDGTEFSSASSVSGSLGMLVCEDPASDSGKMKKARKLGVKIVSYNEFEGMVS